MDRRQKSGNTKFDRDRRDVGTCFDQMRKNNRNRVYSEGVSPDGSADERSLVKRGRTEGGWTR